MTAMLDPFFFFFRNFSARTIFILDFHENNSAFVRSQGQGWSAEDIRMATRASIGCLCALLCKRGFLLYCRSRGFDFRASPWTPSLDCRIKSWKFCHLRKRNKSHRRRDPETPRERPPRSQRVGPLGWHAHNVADYAHMPVSLPVYVPACNSAAGGELLLVTRLK